MSVPAGDEKPTKEELLLRVQTEREAWVTVVDEVADHLTEPGLEGQWSPRDVIAHVGAYERFLVSLLGGHVRELPAQPPDVGTDVEKRNAWLHALDRERPAEFLLAEAYDVHAQLLEQIDRRSTEVLDRPLVDWNDLPTWRWIISLAGDHIRQHATSLRR